LKLYLYTISKTYAVPVNTDNHVQYSNYVSCNHLNLQVNICGLSTKSIIYTPSSWYHLQRWLMTKVHGYVCVRVCVCVCMCACVCVRVCVCVCVLWQLTRMEFLIRHLSSWDYAILLKERGDLCYLIEIY